MKKGPKDTELPVIIKFSNSNVKESVMRAKKGLLKKSLPIFISDHLTKAAAENFTKARALVKDKGLHSAWSFNGLVCTKTSPIAQAVVVKPVKDLPRVSN